MQRMRDLLNELVVMMSQTKTNISLQRIFISILELKMRIINECNALYCFVVILSSHDNAFIFVWIVLADQM